jgi:hypothetical protein
LSCERDTRLAWQHPVDEHQIGQGRLHDTQRRIGVVGANHVMTGVRQIYRYQFLNRWLVFDH